MRQDKTGMKIAEWRIFKSISLFADSRNFLDHLFFVNDLLSEEDRLLFTFIVIEGKPWNALFYFFDLLFLQIATEQLQSFYTNVLKVFLKWLLLQMLEILMLLMIIFPGDLSEWRRLNLDIFSFFQRYGFSQWDYFLFWFWTINFKKDGRLIFFMLVVISDLIIVNPHSGHHFYH